MCNFSVRVRELRLAKKMKQKDVAALLGISERQYQRYEGGEQTTTLENLIALADYFGVSLDYLVGRSDKR